MLAEVSPMVWIVPMIVTMWLIPMLFIQRQCKKWEEENHYG